DGVGAPIRVQCDFCGSQHNSRGMRDEPDAPRAARPRGDERPPLPLVTERELTAAPEAASGPGGLDLELLLRRIIREESGLTPVVPAEKWRDGMLVIRPGSPGLQEKSWPIETFFHKVVMIRNRLRTLEQQVNAMEIPEDAKVRLQ